MNTGILSAKIDDFWTFKDANNPPGRAGASVDATLAGLLVVVVANFLLILAYGFSESEDEHAERLPAAANTSAADVDKKTSAV